MKGGMLNVERRGHSTPILFFRVKNLEFCTQCIIYFANLKNKKFFCAIMTVVVPRQRS